jgi:mono/diheme cytochrome c family protein
LPKLFPDYLPGDQQGYSAVGVYWEAGEETPVGFAKKTVGVIPRISPNCAFCHQGSYRLRADEPSRLVVGGPGNLVQVQAFLRFLTRAGADPRFNADAVMREIAAIYDMPGWEALLYRYVLVPATKSALKEQGARYAWTDSRPDWGPGRIDPFNPVKFYNLGLADDGTIGNSKIMPLWDLAALTPETHYALHWDGLSTSLEETALAGAIGDGLTPNAYEGFKPALAQIVEFARLNQPPPSPFKTTLANNDPFWLDPDRVKAGKAVYMNACAECHEKTGARYRQVIPADEIDTDRHRIDMWTREAAERYLHYAPDYDWGFKAFQKVNGYLANELTGLWLRGPYLHNGSVPTLRDLLNKPAARPKIFYRGYDLIDAENSGFVSQPRSAAERVGWRYDTSVPGNSNVGHLYGTDLKEQEKENLLAYLKTR